MHARLYNFHALIGAVEVSIAVFSLELFLPLSL